MIWTSSANCRQIINNIRKLHKTTHPVSLRISSKATKDQERWATDTHLSVTILGKYEGKHLPRSQQVNRSCRTGSLDLPLVMLLSTANTKWARHSSKWTWVDSSSCLRIQKSNGTLFWSLQTIIPALRLTVHVRVEHTLHAKKDYWRMLEITVTAALQLLRALFFSILTHAWDDLSNNLMAVLTLDNGPSHVERLYFKRKK